MSARGVELCVCLCGWICINAVEETTTTITKNEISHALNACLAFSILLFSERTHNLLIMFSIYY